MVIIRIDLEIPVVLVHACCPIDVEACRGRAGLDVVGLASVDVVIVMLVNTENALHDRVSATLVFAGHEVKHSGTGSVCEISIQDLANLEIRALVHISDIHIVQVVFWTSSDADDPKSVRHSELVHVLGVEDVAGVYIVGHGVDIIPFRTVLAYSMQLGFTQFVLITQNSMLEKQLKRSHMLLTPSACSIYDIPNSVK